VFYFNIEPRLKVLFLALSVTFLVVYEVIRELLDGYVPNSHERCVWSLDRTSLNVKVKGQSSRSPGTKTEFSVLWTACVRFVVGKTSLASIVLDLFYVSKIRSSNVL